MEKRYEFDEVTLLSAVAMGVPGQRTFFLVVGRKGEWVRAWIEKEQLQALALGIDQFLFTISQERPELSPKAGGKPLPDDIPAEFPSAELEVDEIALGYDKGTAAQDCSVHVVGPQKLDRALLHCQVTLAQLKHLGSQAKKVCAAGRPRCVLCGGAIDPTGHVCPRSN